MSTGSPVRPSRRATRKTIIVDESEDELSLIKEDNDEEFTPSPKRSPRKTTRRQTTASVSATPKRSARARKVKTEEGIEPTQMFDPEESLAPSEPTSPTRTPLPRKRKSTSLRKGRRSSIARPVPALPAEGASVSPNLPQTQVTPLMDITSKA
ncbi:Structural maintenance of chromosomes protein 4 [Exophiala xenobiotica]|nr:Structural maintenance of chromosomes protein 4 [Exophiala xenobiotica]KAK5279333.1 Structural maintenance of chromosomes protein 4 [Exophiala xenobiotica]KAK5332464.1 Structural maintenance of chromosomes protein 4 [Exophiala xenobiotica]